MGTVLPMDPESVERRGQIWDEMHREGKGLLEYDQRVKDEIEREIIRKVLRMTGWNRVKAAKILQIAYRSLLDKIAQFKLTPSE